jgi:hypothetical protein
MPAGRLHFTCVSTQILKRELSDRLACKIRGPRLINTIKHLFKGRVRDSGGGKDVELLIQLDLPFVDLEAGLEENLQEHLRRMKTKTCGQGDQMGECLMRVTKFPPVLTIQLSRFVVHEQSGSVTKNCHRFAFPTRVDLEPHLSDDKKSSGGDETGAGEEMKGGEEAKGVAGPGPESFCLHSVLVHRGDTSSGRTTRTSGRPRGVSGSSTMTLG